MSKAKKDNDALDDLITWYVDEETGEIIASNIEGKKVSIKKYEGKEVLPAYPYAIGADVHRDFMQYSIMVRIDKQVKEYHFQSKTDYDSLLHAKDFAIKIIEEFSDPHIDVDPNSLLRSKFFDEYEIVVYNSFDGFPVVIEPPYVL